MSRSADAFFFAPASARPLAALRIGVAAVLLAQAWLLRSETLAFLAHDGLVQGELSRTLADPFAPRVGWLVERLSPLGVGEAPCIHAACLAYVASLVLTAAGLCTRPASALAWLLHWALVSAGHTAYGATRTRTSFSSISRGSPPAARGRSTSPSAARPPRRRPWRGSASVSCSCTCASRTSPAASRRRPARSGGTARSYGGRSRSPCTTGST